MISPLILSPLSLYIHIPWCIKKCPYCDFNSHPLKNPLPEAAYIAALVDDLKQDLSKFKVTRPIQTIFFGGGTPSLMSPKGIGDLLTTIQTVIPFAPNIEITLETNPGTVEHHRMAAYRQAGITRISLGTQSFDNEKLKSLGRIHQSDEILTVIEEIQQAGFQSFNLDLMYGLPNQTLEEALTDLRTAIAQNPPHLSWYHLTLEPNTLFYHKPPKRPNDDIMWAIQEQGEALLKEAGFEHYEVSAFSKPGHHCQHNLNYWQFGDYLGIGAGAHGKITDVTNQCITRTRKERHPKAYLDKTKPYLADHNIVTPDALPFEFMLNQLRLYRTFSLDTFIERTGLSLDVIEAPIQEAFNKGMLDLDNHSLRVTKLGTRFLNDLMALFLTPEHVS